MPREMEKSGRRETRIPNSPCPITATEYQLPKTRRPSRHGVTVTELLVAAFLVGILVLAAFSLFKSSWQSYDNLVWQPKVNMEARQTLDDICDMIRMGGTNMDMMRPSQMTWGFGQVYAESTGNKLSLFTNGPNDMTYQVWRSNRDNINYATRRNGSNPNNRKKFGQFIKSIQFEYEYRLPSTSDADPVWRFRRVTPPGTSSLDQTAYLPAAYLATTIYVTVTAEAQPYGTNGPTYRRVLTGAVALRGPLGLTMPPAVYNTLQQVDPDPDGN
jgi:hypothetical protein